MNSDAARGWAAEHEKEEGTAHAGTCLEVAFDAGRASAPLPAKVLAAVRAMLLIAAEPNGMNTDEYEDAKSRVVTEVVGAFAAEADIEDIP